MNRDHKLDLLDMPEMLGVLFDDVDHAQERIDIECYIFSSDEFGKDFAERMCKAKGRGVKTRALYDPLGSQKAEEKFFEEMCGKGVDFRPYRPLWKTLGSGKLAPRDHGRIFLVDQIAVTGGAAWAKPWAPKDRGGEGWQDINIRIEGPVVADFAELFEQRWREAEGKGAQPKDFDTGKKYDELRLVVATPGVGLATAKARAALPDHLHRRDALFNMQRVLLLVHALQTKDYERLREGVRDRWHQPARSNMVPLLADVLALEDPDVLGAFLSGAGPSIAVIARQNFERLEQLLSTMYATAGHQATVRTLTVHHAPATERAGASVSGR